MAGKIWHAEHETAPIEGCALCYPSDSSTTNEGKKEEVLRYIPCDGGHGSSQYCYLQDDGTHVQRDICICNFFENPDCPIDLHRHHAGKPLDGGSRLFA